MRRRPSRSCTSVDSAGSTAVGTSGWLVENRPVSRFSRSTTTKRSACSRSNPAASPWSSPDELFVRGAEQHKAKAVCGACPVRAECLAEALDNEIEWGVWGGLTERERRALLRQRPNVTSWRQLLETAKSEHDIAVAEVIA